MMASIVDEQKYARNIQLELSALLSTFGRSIDKFRFVYDVSRDTQRCDAVVMLPWGEHIQVGAELWASTLAEHGTHDIIEWYVFSMAKHILKEEDIKEEVAEGTLHPEALDTLAGIQNVINTLVIQ